MPGQLPIERGRNLVRECVPDGTARTGLLALLEELEYMRAANVALAAGHRIKTAQIAEEQGLRKNLLVAVKVLQETVKNLLEVLSKAEPVLPGPIVADLQAMAEKIRSSPVMRRLK